MATKKITLIYQLTNLSVNSPRATDIERKDEWIRSIQKKIPSGQSRYIKQTFEEYDPEVLNSRKFFEGVVIVYYAIQNKDILEGYPDSALLRDQRESLLNEILGYNPRMAKFLGQDRASTVDFREVQQWNLFLNIIKEEYFDPNGYEFPDSDEFWELATTLRSYDEAHKVSIKRLQESLRRKYKTND